MAQDLQPGPIPYATLKPTRLKPIRPTAVTVLSIIGIILGVTGLLVGISGLALAVSTRAFSQAAQQNPALAAVNGSTFLRVSTAAAAIAYVALAGVLLVASIAALGLMSWARRLMVYYAFAGIALNLLLLVITLAFVVPAMGATTAGHSGKTAGLVGDITILLVRGAFRLVYPICILIIMRRPDIVAAFEGHAATDPGSAVASDYQAPPWDAR